jgi:hypothetical protein
VPSATSGTATVKGLAATRSRPAGVASTQRGTAPNGERLDRLVVYDIDRLTRDNRHLEDAIEVVEHYGRPILDFTDTLDLLTDNGRTIARILVATSNKQSADTARRTRRKHQAPQQAGIPVGGRRPFGWQADKRTLDKDEAETVPAAAARILAGAPIGAIVADWNAHGHGVVTPSGNGWSRASVKAILRNPRMCGYRARAIRTPRGDGKSASLSSRASGHRPLPETCLNATLAAPGHCPCQDVGARSGVCDPLRTVAHADGSSPDHGESITSREPSSMSGHRGARSRVGGF